MYIHPKSFILSTECFTTCHILHATCHILFFPGMFGDIPRNIWRHSPEYLATFPGIFGDIPQNVRGNSPECLATFPRMFEDIPKNVWPHSPEYNILPIPCDPRIPFPVPVFLVLYIAKFQCPLILNTRALTIIIVM